MKKLPRLFIAIALLVFSLHSFSQLYPVSFNEKINSSILVVEGEVVKQVCFWNESHTTIYTSNTVKVYKLFKGVESEKEIEVLTLGGTVENYAVLVSDVLQLRNGATGIFCLHLLNQKILSPVTKKELFSVYSSDQGMFRYDLETQKAYCPFAKYKIDELYNLIDKKTGTVYSVIDNSFSGKYESPMSPGGTAALISSFSPTTVHGGAINDPANNVLTINGSGFGAVPSGKCGVVFKSGNSSDPNPNVTQDKINYNSPYFISWSDNQIQIRVSSDAATGIFDVILSDGTIVKTTTPLTVFYSLLDGQFDISGEKLIKEPRLMNVNGSGGYTILYSTNTAGNGINLSTDPALGTVQRALATWKETAGANITEGGNTTVQKIDPYDYTNVIIYDNANTGIPPLDAGVLELTTSGFQMCGDKSLSAQKIGFDILLRNSKVSVGGNILINDGPCYPPIGEYDLELIVLHEFGHALNLAHINDDYEKTSSNYNTINPAKLMHYAVLDFTNRRSPDASAFEGVLYTTEKQNNSYGNCGLFSEEMQTLPPIVEANDNCPSTFPSTPLVDGTSVVFDLVHATSNKYTDPSFEQVNCQSTGTFVTNNAYFAFETSDSIKQSLQINISGYTTVPAELNSCNEQGVRLALYDVSTCPQGQNFPQPITCNTFSSDGSVTPITGLIPNHKYLLYFDGIRNTKAIFNASFNRSDAAGINNTVSISPNPVQGLLSIRFLNTAVAQYQYALYDPGGKLINTATLNVSPIAFDYKINMTGLASGIYFLRVVNSKGDILTKQKILKVTQ